MPIFQRNRLEQRFSQIRDYEARFNWQKLGELGLSGGDVANFGCASGRETFALMWYLAAQRAVGIDKDIAEARRFLSEIQELLTESQMVLTYAAVSPEDQLWWDDLPAFVREANLPTFIEREIKAGEPAGAAVGAELSDDSFDLSYCDNFLYLVLDDQGNAGVQAALGEMKRVVKPGGYIVVSEPNQVSPRDSTPLDFTRFFEEAGLERLSVESYGRSTTYAHRKVNAG
ncbi:MAG: methyltransferase domain-containing protein [Chloroflexi bacterium]|nr:methyltransferase domain-containing protein [Chloroflexota bacterium]MCI0730060.1 methyltransferase domain-containing protein [Chloroflexota bacterium]